MTAHPRLRTRGTPRHAVREDERVRVLMYGPEAARERWIEDLDGGAASIQIGHTVAGVICALIDDPPPRPQVLVIDLDHLTPAEVMELHQIRDQGWCGTLVTAGPVSKSLLVSLRIEFVLTETETLSQIVQGIDHAKATRRIPLITG